MGCTDSQKFKTAEAASKAAMRTQGAIDKYLNILDINKFRKLNLMWSADAKKRFGIEEKLFFEENDKAIPNKTAFQAIDRQKGIYYQQVETPPSAVQVEPKILEELNNFELFEDREKLCASGICNYTARQATLKLEELGLNPFPVGPSGSTLAVTVKSPLGDFNITHYIAAVVIGNQAYVYDMPQNEFISSDFYGEGSDVKVKSTFKPRLIALTSDDIMANYNLSYQEALHFINQLLSTGKNNNRNEFEEYIRARVKDSSEYLDALKEEIEQNYEDPYKEMHAFYDKSWEERQEQLQRERERRKRKEFAKKPTSTEEDKVLNLIKTKLKFRTREYVPKNKESFLLRNLLINILGTNNGFEYDYSQGLDSVLDKLKRYLESEEFLDRLWDNYELAKTSLDGLDKQVEGLLLYRDLMFNFIKQVKYKGWEEALSGFSSERQYIIRAALPKDIMRYTSDAQRIYVINQMLERQMVKAKPNFELRYKAAQKFQKLKTLLAFLKMSEFDTEYLFSVIANEARRQYAYFHARGQEYFQNKNTQLSGASPETLTRVKEAAKKMGIRIEDLNTYARRAGLNIEGINGVADVMYKIAAIAEGKEDVALTEEVVHIATAMLEQVNPALVTEMISKISDYQIYKDTLNQYKENKNYQLPDGKPDIRKIKKEAVDKLIADIIMNGGENNLNESSEMMVRNWWQKILDAIRALFKKSGVDIFEQAAQQILEGDIQTEAPLMDETYYELSQEQKDFQQKIANTARNIRKVSSTEKPDSITEMTDEDDNWYERLTDVDTWKRVKKRVTDRVKSWYRRKFRDKNFTKEEKAYNEFKRNYGIKGHSFFQNVQQRFYNPDGTKREAALPRPQITNDVDLQVYLKAETYFLQMIKRLSDGGKKDLLVFSEVVIYDSKEDEAGTLDMLVMEQDGTAHILDWKFMTFSNNSEDVAWYKQEAYDIQLGRYKEILTSRYGVKKVGMNRAIPIMMKITSTNKVGQPTQFNVTGIVMGSADPTQIEDLRLMPVAERSESTGIELLDDLIGKLNALHKQISKTRVKTEDEREFKRDRLNIIRRTVRIIQSTLNIQPLIDTIKILRAEGQMLVQYYDEQFKGKDPSTFENAEVSEFAKNINEYLKMAGIFDDIDVLLGDILYTPGMEDEATTPEERKDALERKKIFDNISNEVKMIKLSRIKIEKLSGEFADRFIGIRNLVSGLLDPEAVVKGISSIFRSVGELPLASLRILTKLVSEARGMASQDAMAEVDELLAIRKKLAERGGNLRNLVQKLYRKDKEGRMVNSLVYKYKSEFYDGVKNNALENNRSKQWLYDNIDIEGYKREAEKMLEDRIQRINQLYEDDDDLRDDLILQEKQRWDIDRADFTGFDNYILKRHPLLKWESDEYRAIKDDAELMELYNFIVKMNEKALGVGYIENMVGSTFLPFVRKGMAESLAWDFSLSAISNWAKTLTMRIDDVGYGQINEITGEIENSIPKYFTHDFTKEDGSLSEVSEDLFKNMILYITHMEKYKYLSEIEGQIQLVQTVETFFKDHLRTNRASDVINDENKIEKGNEKNAELLDVFVRAMLYEQKYPLSDSDTAIGVTKAVNFFKRGINKVLGEERFPLSDETTTTLSLIKSMDAINRAFQLKTLGFEVISGAVNIFGANIQVATQAGHYFKVGEFIKNETKLLGNKFRGEDEREMFVQLIDLFMPLKDDPNYERLRKAGMSRLTRTNFSDMIMMFMKYPEQHLEKALFLTLLENMMVVDGKIVSIPEYVKNKYKGRYASRSIYRTSSQEIEKEIEELKKTKSIEATKTLVDGKLQIPGLDLTNRKEIMRLTALTQRIARNATGAMTTTDMNKMGLSIWTNSMMVFKRWIPKLVDTRFGEFRKVSDDFSVVIDENGLTTGEKYDIGRIRLLFYVLGTSIRDMSTNITHIMRMDEKGIQLLDDMYEQFSISFEKRNGKPLNMTKEDFIDLIRMNLRNQIRELAMALSLVGAAFALGMVGPDEENDLASKNAHRYARRVVDRFTQELLFFYNPIEFQKLLSGSTFPAIGLFSDITRAMNHIVEQFTGYDIGNPTKTADEVRKAAQPIKNIARLFPGSKSFLTYGAMLDSDFAKEFDITVSAQSRLR